MNWYLAVLKKYTDFAGRATRTEYWMFLLFNLIIQAVLDYIDYRTGTLNLTVGLGLLSGIYTLAVLLPSIAVTVRRLHDTSRSGWWLLIGFVPIIGGLILLVFLVLDSKPETNAWGPSPKAVPVA